MTQQQKKPLMTWTEIEALIAETRPLTQADIEELLRDEEEGS